MQVWRIELLYKRKWLESVKTKQELSRKLQRNFSKEMIGLEEIQSTKNDNHYVIKLIDH